MDHATANTALLATLFATSFFSESIRLMRVIARIGRLVVVSAKERRRSESDRPLMHLDKATRRPVMRDEDLEMELMNSRPPGGQHVGVEPRYVKVTHKPTGLSPPA